MVAVHHHFYSVLIHCFETIVHKSCEFIWAAVLTDYNLIISIGSNSTTKLKGSDLGSYRTFWQK